MSDNTSEDYLKHAWSTIYDFAIVDGFGEALATLIANEAMRWFGEGTPFDADNFCVKKMFYYGFRIKYSSPPSCSLGEYREKNRYYAPELFDRFWSLNGEKDLTAKPHHFVMICCEEMQFLVFVDEDDGLTKAARLFVEEEEEEAAAAAAAAPETPSTRSSAASTSTYWETDASDGEQSVPDVETPAAAPPSPEKVPETVEDDTAASTTVPESRREPMVTVPLEPAQPMRVTHTHFTRLWYLGAYLFRSKKSVKQAKFNMNNRPRYHLASVQP